MSQENVEIVRQAFAEFGESAGTALQAFLEEEARAGRIAPDAELDFSAMYPDAPIIRGVDAWFGYLASMPWGGSVRLEPERFFDVDDEAGTHAAAPRRIPRDRDIAAARLIPPTCIRASAMPRASFPRLSMRSTG